MKNAVAQPATATPKLIDICCAVLAMELALLASPSAMSVNTVVFILVHCSDVNAP
jgi:hypothetical protein